MFVEAAEHLIRTALLLALTVAPTALSPEPPPSANPPFFGLLSAMALAALLYASVVFARHVDTVRARFAVALLWLALALALVMARVYAGEGAPLARGVPAMALPVWGALAALASAAGDRWLGSNWKHRQMAPVVIVLCLGALQIGGAAKLLGSTEKMWWSALRRDADHPRALEALAAPARRAHKDDELQKIAGRCLELHPGHCGCLELKARALLSAHADATAAARAAADKCPKGEAPALVAEALAAAGDGMGAEAAARKALGEGAPEPRLRYALAVALERQGRYPEAAEEAKKAVDLGAGRDAQLLAGGLLILQGDAAQAEAMLQPLARGDDADARYNLALIADKRGDYNKAREGYLAALKADPRHANARYNLAVLTFRRGIVEESRHHVKKLAEAWPKDPRLPDLYKLTGAGPQ